MWLLMISNTVSFGMVTIAGLPKSQYKKNSSPKFKAAQSAGFESCQRKFSYGKQKKNTDKIFTRLIPQETLAVRSAELELEALRNFTLTTDIMFTIAAVNEDGEVKNNLQKTCRLLNKNLSKTAPNVYQLALYPEFRAHKDDITFILLHAACDKRIDVLKNVLSNTQERLFYYEESRFCYKGRPLMEKHVPFDLPMVCALNKLGSYNTHNNEVDFSLEVDSDTNNSVCLKTFKNTVPLKLNPLPVAVYSGNMTWVTDILSHEVDQSDLRNACFIAINQNNTECIKAVATKVKIPDHIWYTFLLKTAMIQNKKNAFEALVEKDPFGHLNSCSSGRSTLNIIDGYPLVDKWQKHEEYITIYRRYGGQRRGEMQQEDRKKEKAAKDSYCTLF